MRAPHSPKVSNQDHGAMTYCTRYSTIRCLYSQGHCFVLQASKLVTFVWFCYPQVWLDQLSSCPAVRYVRCAIDSAWAMLGQWVEMLGTIFALCVSVSSHIMYIIIYVFVTFCGWLLFLTSSLVRWLVGWLVRCRRRHRCCCCCCCCCCCWCWCWWFCLKHSSSRSTIPMVFSPALYFHNPDVLNTRCYFMLNHHPDCEKVFAMIIRWWTQYHTRRPTMLYWQVSVIDCILTNILTTNSLDVRWFSKKQPNYYWRFWFQC